MYQSVRRYLTGPEPVVCYQGAVVADPTTGEFLRHVPIPLELAREAIDAIQRQGRPLNCYVDDELYVAHVTWHAEQYARFQQIELHEVGDLLRWLDRPPTKLVVAGDPDELDELSGELRRSFADRLYISKSLPIFLEFADPSVLPVARRMMATKDVPLRLAALRAIGDLGNSSDLPALRMLAAKAENATPGGRGFGLMPALDLSRAAQNAIHQIEQRM